MNVTEKRIKIMNAAAATFAKYGYKKTTIDEIVSAAGISKGLFYHYYSDKLELYLQLYEDYTDILSNNIAEAVDTNETDFVERLKQISHIRIAFINEYPDLWSFLYSAYYEQHPDVAAAIKMKNEKMVKESFHKSAYNIDWSKLKSGITPQKAIMLVTWIAEGFVRTINADKIEVNETLYLDFDNYMELLKTGIYEDKGGK